MKQSGTYSNVPFRGLLRDMPARLPADCLSVRIRGRRSFLVRDWERLLLARKPLEALGSAPWRLTAGNGYAWARQALQQEYYWAFSRMDEQVRRSTAPFFWLAELRTLASCVRLLAGGAPDLTGLLQYSLLANAVKAPLQKAESSAAALAGLTDVLAGYDFRFAGLDEIWRTGGAGALETAMYDISLSSVADPSLHPAMRCYLKLMIDSRNLTRVAKRLRWRMASLPPLLEGGTLPLSRLAGLFARRDSAGLQYLAMRLGGEAPYSDTADPERVLFEAQDRVMRRLARGEDGMGAILDYLWRCGNEAANIGLLECLESVGIEQVGSELRR